MKKVRNVIIAIIVLLMIIIIGKVLYNKMQPENMRVKMKAVVVKVNENSMTVIRVNSNRDLMNIGFTDEGNVGYKQGQEILIYYDGLIDSMYPGHIGNPGKIKIIKEESNIEIPEKALRYCYSSMNNVFVQVSELTNKEIILKFTDTNKLKFVFANSYKIKKEEKNPYYTGTGYKIGEDTENSTATYVGAGSEYIDKELNKISNISSENTQETITVSNSCIEKKFNFESLYGKLDSGRYTFILADAEDSIGVVVKFSIDENGEISYDEPEFIF